MDIREWRGDERLAQDEPVASLLRAAAAPSEPGPQPGEEAALAAFRATHQTLGRNPMRSTRMKAAFAAAVSAGVLLTGGIAAAATGTLPGAAQLGFGTHAKADGGDQAPSQADTRGDSADQTSGSDETTDVTDQVPGDDETAGTDAQDTEDSTSTDSTDSTDAQDRTSDSTDGEHAAPEHPANHGADVSGVAKDHSTTGKAHGEAVSAAARDNAGQTKSDDSTESDDSTDSTGSTGSKPAPGTERSDTGATASQAKGDDGQQGSDSTDSTDGTDTTDAGQVDGQ